MSKNPLVAQLISEAVRAQKAYHVADATGMIKLDAMENPYSWPPALLDILQHRLRSAAINRYPDPTARALQAELRRAMSIPEGLDILLGNGSDELIQIILTAVAQPDRSVLSPTPSFVMYQLIASTLGMQYRPVPLQLNNFELDVDATLNAIEQHKPSVVFLAYPNNPTGNRWDPDALRRIVRSSPGLVVIDEAYYPYANHSFIGEVEDYPSVLLMRTVSKLGLAGLRLGILIGAPAWITEFDKIRLPYNINVLTQLTAQVALENHAEFNTQVAAIIAERAVVFAALNQLPGIVAYPSEANFILFKVESGRAEAVFEGLKQAKILIKKFPASDAALKDCLRVTIGSPAENAAFIDALRNLL